VWRARLGTDATPHPRPAARNVPDIILVSMHDEEDFADLIRDSIAVGFLAKSDLSARAICRLLCAGRDAK
jgi:hypothetical protein